MTTKLIHCGDESHIVYIARVSSNQDNDDPGLLGYLIRNGHWSPFEMVGACIEFNTTRDIGRQMLRHRSFSFQEFSGRYAEYSDLRSDRDLRFKGTTNRQGSRPAETPGEEAFIHDLGIATQMLASSAMNLYRYMVEGGIAPECARAVLPEGLTPTRIYQNGTLRSWIHYVRERMKHDVKTGVRLAQKEHYDLAVSVKAILTEAFPVTFEALAAIGYFDEEAA